MAARENISEEQRAYLGRMTKRNRASAIDITGQKFGLWLAVQRAPDTRRPAWLCRCDCGTERIVQSGNLRSGRSTGCGCMVPARSRATHRTHGYSSTRTYKIWCNMKARCMNPRTTHFAHYGGRGIAVCDRWLYDYPAFLSDMGECPPGYTIERNDNDGNYEPGNCRWATQAEQTLNQRRSRYVEWRGERLSVKGWALRLDITETALKSRLSRWPIDRAMIHPVRRSQQH